MTLEGSSYIYYYYIHYTIYILHIYHNVLSDSSENESTQVVSSTSKEEILLPSELLSPIADEEPKTTSPPPNIVPDNTEAKTDQNHPSTSSATKHTVIQQKKPTKKFEPGIIRIKIEPGTEVVIKKRIKTIDTALKLSIQWQ